jgi:predicted DNA-binding protein with PD1-like motif
MRVHAFRLTPGTDLRAELERITERLALRAGFILTGVGSLAAARLRMPGAMAPASAAISFRVASSTPRWSW